jgi:hypothetical protein
MIRNALRAIVLSIACCFVFLATALSASNASANVCFDMFDARPVRSLGPKEFGMLYYNNGAGRNFLSIGHLMGSMNKRGVTYLTLSGDSGSLRHFDSSKLFMGIDPVRARAIVINPNIGIATAETRIVTLIGMRKNGDKAEYIARPGDGQLLRVVEILEIYSAEAN